MKSLAMFVFLVICATQAYAFCAPPVPVRTLVDLVGCPDNHLRPYYPSVPCATYPSVPCASHVPCKACHGCQTCKPKKSSELYGCPYRQHGPCECRK